MFFRRKGRYGRGRDVGKLLVAVGLGIFLAYVIPYFLLISFFAAALICCGIALIIK